MPKFQAPKHVNSVSVAGVEYAVEKGLIEAPHEVYSQILPLGFILVNEQELNAAGIAEAEAKRIAAEKLTQEEQRKADEAAQKKVQTEAKKQADVDDKARVKAEAEAKSNETAKSTQE